MGIQAQSWRAGGALAAICLAMLLPGCVVQSEGARNEPGSRDNPLPSNIQPPAEVDPPPPNGVDPG